MSENFILMLERELPLKHVVQSSLKYCRT